MNTTTDNTSDNSSRPFGYWLKAVDRLMAQEFATAFAAEGATRRDWRLLNVVDGSAPSRRPLNPHKLHDLVDRGWVEADGDGWTLTGEGRAAKERLGAAVDSIRAKVAGAVSDEEMATTLAALEKIARAFDWDEETPLPGSGVPGSASAPGTASAAGTGTGTASDPDTASDPGTSSPGTASTVTMARRTAGTADAVTTTVTHTAITVTRIAATATATATAIGRSGWRSAHSSAASTPDSATATPPDRPPQAPHPTPG